MDARENVKEIFCLFKATGCSIHEMFNAQYFNCEFSLFL